MLISIMFPVTVCFGAGSKGWKAGIWDLGAGSREQGAESREQGAGIKDQGSGSRDQGALCLSSGRLRLETTRRCWIFSAPTSTLMSPVLLAWTFAPPATGQSHGRPSVVLRCYIQVPPHPNMALSGGQGPGLGATLFRELTHGSRTDKNKNVCY